MQNQYSRLFIVSSIFLAFLASCNLPQTPTPSVKPADTLPVEPTINVTTETGGNASTEFPSSQNPLPPAVNLEKSSIDLQKLGKDIAGGGGSGFCSVELAIKTEQRIFLLYNHNDLGHQWKLCFTNFPVGNALVKLSTKSGMFDGNVNLEPVLDEVETYSLYINLPVSVRRDGPLKVELSVGDAIFTQTIDIQTMDLVGIYNNDVTMLDAGNLSSPNYNFGDQIELLGVGLLPSTTIYVGIYGNSISFNGWLFYPLVDQFEATTNEAGEFLGVVQITEKYRQGSYIIYYEYTSKSFEYWPHRDYAIFTVGGISPTWQPCPADYASRLRVGDIGIVSNNPPLANNVRNSPSLSGEMVGQLQPREQFVILDGPVCDGGWIWWYVQKDDALTGWTSEGDLNNYWLVKPPEQ